ncbi:MAG: hypothetical protein KA171_06105 [Reyranella sp.]|nr:hypothetical protein [Reyranella sp.]
MTRRRIILGAAALATAASWGATLPARAHDAKGPNGGQLTDAGKYHVELVGKGTRLEVFISDANDKPLPATGFKALAILVIDGKPQRIPLQPEGADRLSGPLPGPLASPAKGVLQLTAPDGTVAQAKFN